MLDFVQKLGYFNPLSMLSHSHSFFCLFVIQRASFQLIFHKVIRDKVLQVVGCCDFAGYTVLSVLRVFPLTECVASWHISKIMNFFKVNILRMSL